MYIPLREGAESLRTCLKRVSVSHIKLHILVDRGAMRVILKILTYRSINSLVFCVHRDYLKAVNSAKQHRFDS